MIRLFEGKALLDWAVPLVAAIGVGVLVAGLVFRGGPPAGKDPALTVLLLLGLCAFLWYSHATRMRSGDLSEAVARVRVVLLAVTTAGVGLYAALSYFMTAG